MIDRPWLVRAVRWTWQALRRYAPAAGRAGVAKHTATISVGRATLRIHSWSDGAETSPSPRTAALTASQGLRELACVAELGTVVGAHVVDASREAEHHFVLAYRRGP